MIHKITVGLQQKISQPNFGSLGASCNIEVQLDNDEASHPVVIANRVIQAFAQCRACIERELALNDTEHPSDNASAPRNLPSASQTRLKSGDAPDRNHPRQATEAQVRAIRAIAAKAGLSLASELEQCFGVRSPNQLTIAQASQLIDSMKQALAPSPA